MRNRIIDKIKGDEKGYEIILIAGMHGNEQAGVRAIKKVMKFIRNNNIPVRGNMTALYGNITALEKNVRFIDRDLNRLWTNEFIEIAQNNSDISEMKELKELHREIENICNGDYENCIIIDFHSFSTASGIFVIPAYNEKSLNLAKDFRVQFIEKLTSDLKETAIQYFAFKGVTAVVFEGGQHYSDETEGNTEAAVYVALNYLKFLDKKNVIKFNSYRKRLKEKSLNLPTHYELSYIHRIENGDIFKMNPGYVNFQTIKKNEILAYENGKPVFSAYNGRMLMPLYQKQGTNGFYIIHEA